MPELRVGLIGAGVFAGYHAQKVAASDLADLVGVFDLNIDAAKAVTEKVGQGEAVSDVDALIMASDALMIATPATSHAQLAARALRAGKHVFVEKPLALTAAESQALVALAATKNVILQVGHQERLVFDAMGVLSAPETPTRLEAVRAAPPSPTGRCEDVSAVFDLMVHDIDLANCIFSGEGRVTKAKGKSAHTSLLDEAHAEITYDNGVAHFIASRCAPERKRTMRITYPSGDVSIDFLAKTVDNNTPFDIKLDVSDIIPDPLQAADEAFFSAAAGHSQPIIPGEDGAHAASLAEAVEQAAISLVAES